jgi:two-component system, OmpR family, sensor kinase
MDGVQERLGASLQRRLSLALCGVIALLALLAGAWSFATAWQEAQELQDNQLVQLAALVKPQSGPGATLGGQDVDQEAQVRVQWLRPAPAAPGDGMLPLDLPDGLQTVSVRGDTWRVLVKTVGPKATVALAQRTAVRDEVAQDSALRTVTPLLVLVPLLLLLVAVLVRQMLVPLTRLAADLDARSEQDLRPVVAPGLPSEVGPLVAALNRTLHRVAGAVALQQRFVADAAHELRTPLTALSLHAEQLEAAALPSAAHARVLQLRAGMARSRALIDQMLALAQVQAPQVRPLQTVALRPLLRELLETLAPLAQHKGVDLGVVGEEDASVQADPLLLFSLVKNLVDNAVRYTPNGGQVDLAISHGARGVCLSVTDTGPGIAADLRERVFEPFYRVLGSDQAGSGLGLAIVRSTAEQLGARIELDDAHPEDPTGVVRGLRVRVWFSEEGR